MSFKIQDPNSVWKVQVHRQIALPHEVKVTAEEETLVVGVRISLVQVAEYRMCDSSHLRRSDVKAVGRNKACILERAIL